MADERVLVPVAESPTLRETVEYAVSSVLEDARPDDVSLVRFVYVHSLELVAGDAQSDARQAAAEDLLDQVSVWAEADAGDRAGDLTVETVQVGQDRFLFSPQDLAERLEAEARESGIDRVLFDPEYDPGIGTPTLRPLEVELANGTGLTVQEAPVERGTRRVPLVGTATAIAFGTLFGLAFLFYQTLGGGELSTIDLVSGAISATVVAVALGQVTITREPDRHTLFRALRMIVYTPYLLYEIFVSNVVIARTILDPRRSIDPRMTRIRTRVWGPLATTTLANSITLTPGTLTVRTRGQDLVVHTLVPWARDGLFDGSLERGVRFVFYGRGGMNLASPRERGDTELLQEPAGDAESGEPTVAGDIPDEGSDTGAGETE